jgi:hypothetical protein
MAEPIMPPISCSGSAGRVDLAQSFKLLTNVGPSSSALVNNVTRATVTASKLGPARVLF